MSAIEIKTVGVSHNGKCFHSGEKVGGKITDVALLIQDGEIKTAFPVHKACDERNPEAIAEWVRKSDERKTKHASKVIVKASPATRKKRVA